MKKYIVFAIIGVLFMSASSASAYSYKYPTVLQKIAPVQTTKNPINIERRAPHIFTVATALPDLVVTSVQWTQIYNTGYGTGPVSQSLFPTQPYVYFYVCLQNIGAGPAVLNGGQNYHFEIYRTPATPANIVAGYQFQTPIILNPGGFNCFVDNSIWVQPMGLSLIFGGVAPSVRNYTATVDPYMQIAESNEANNSLTFNMTTNP